MDIAQRLTVFREYIGLTNSQFADKAGIPRPTLSQFLNGRNKRLSDEFTSKLHVAFPNLNILWLLFGEGQMVCDENIEVSEGKNGEISTDSDVQNIVCEQLSLDLNTQSDCSENELNGNYADAKPNCGHENVSEVSNSKPFPSFIPMDGAAQQNSNSKKTITQVMVFYSDSSYELFTPKSFN